jgi:hypothetical protein
MVLAKQYPVGEWVSDVLIALQYDNYSVYFRRESGYCAIEWSSPNNTQSVNGSAGYFTLSGLAQTAALTPADAKVLIIV